MSCPKFRICPQICPQNRKDRNIKSAKKHKKGLKTGKKAHSQPYIGGANGIRTHDLLNAIQTRYQLRYNPINFIFIIQETLPNWQAISTEKLRKISSFRSPTYLRTIKKERNMRSFHGGLSGTRTLGPLIKSQLLYQLS